MRTYPCQFQSLSCTLNHLFFQKWIEPILPAPARSELLGFWPWWEMRSIKSGDFWANSLMVGNLAICCFWDWNEQYGKAKYAMICHDFQSLNPFQTPRFQEFVTSELCRHWKIMGSFVEWGTASREHFVASKMNWKCQPSLAHWWWDCNAPEMYRFIHCSFHPFRNMFYIFASSIFLSWLKVMVIATDWNLEWFFGDAPTPGYTRNPKIRKCQV